MCCRSGGALLAPSIYDNSYQDDPTWQFEENLLKEKIFKEVFQHQVSIVLQMFGNVRNTYTKKLQIRKGATAMRSQNLNFITQKVLPGYMCKTQNDPLCLGDPYLKVWRKIIIFNKIKKVILLFLPSLKNDQKLSVFSVIFWRGEK